MNHLYLDTHRECDTVMRSSKRSFLKRHKSLTEKCFQEKVSGKIGPIVRHIYPILKFFYGMEFYYDTIILH